MKKQPVFWMCLFLLFVSTTGAGLRIQPAKKAAVVLAIEQRGNLYMITPEHYQIDLYAEPFKLIFEAKETKVVFMHSCTLDSSYQKAVAKNYKHLTCFGPQFAMAEGEKNNDRDLMVCTEENRGCQYLVAFDENPQMIRFDILQGTPKQWKGTRTVNSIYEVSFGTMEWKDMKGKTFYSVYSPGIENFGYPLKIRFKE